MKFLKNTFYFLTIISLTISFSCSKRLELEPAIGLSSVDVYKDADNYVNVLGNTQKSNVVAVNLFRNE